MSAVPPLKKNPHHGHAAAVTSRKSRKPLLLIAPSTDIVSPATPAPNFSNVLALRSEEHTSELQSLAYLVCRLLLEKKNTSELQSLAYLVCRLLLEKKKQSFHRRSANT